MAKTLEMPFLVYQERMGLDLEEQIYAVRVVVKGAVVGVGVDAVEAAATVAAGNQIAASYCPVCMGRMKTEVAPEKYGEAAPFLDHGTLAAALVGAGRDPARRMHSSQDRD